MGYRKHRRKNSHVVIVTSDATNARMKQFRVRPWIAQAAVTVLCVILGALIGYFVFEKDIWETSNQQIAQRNETIAALEQEKAGLEGQIAGLNTEIEGLNEQVKILSETVSRQVLATNELAAQLEKQTLPTGFPLSGKATMEEVTEGTPICIFTAKAGAMVVAAAKGMVTVVNEDPEYGYNVWVDHGNGYVTIYRNAGDVKVRQGEAVLQGATLILITGDDSKLGYQMTKDGAYVNPMDMLDISG